MKKHLLITTGLLVSGMMVAQVPKQAVKTKFPAHLANMSIKKTNAPEDKTINVLTGPKKQITNKRVAAQTEAIIGTTYYDLQSNSSVGDRIVVNADGSIAAVWTIEATYSGSTFPNRGTGYNYFNGTTWGPSPVARVENARVGWGNVVNTASGGDLVLAHGIAGNLINLATRPVKGTGAWSNATGVFPVVAGGNLWPRMVTSNPNGGDTIYVISISAPTANTGVVYNGLDGALLFSRSTDGGDSWDIANVQPAGFTSATFKNFGGDAYAIAAKGSTVAILSGDSGKDLVLSKSTDGGVTWTAKTALKFPLPLWDYTTTTTDVDNDGTADTLYTNDGTLAVGLDNNGLAYAFYGETRILNDAPSASGYSYFPYTDGLYMWHENMPQDNGGVLVAAIEDLGGDNTISFPAQSVQTNLAFGRYGNSLTSFPSVAWDANNIMYLSYSSVVDGLASLPNSEKLVRHVYITKSCDGGNSWSDPYDVVGAPGGVDYEGVYASMAKRVDSDVHLVYQRDIFAGYGVPPSSGTNPDNDNLGENNDIIYVKVPTVDIACSIFTGIKDAQSVAAINFYPNPASTNGTIEVSLNENVKMDVVVLSSTGQVVYKTTVNGNAGSNKVDINLSNLSSGMYFYQVKMENNKTVTKKFVVEK